MTIACIPARDDDAAWFDLLQRLEHIAYRDLRDRDLAGDVAREILREVLSKGGLDAKGDPITPGYLVAACRHRAKQEKRRRAVAQKHHQALAARLSQSALLSQVNPVRQLDLAEAALQLMQIIGELPHKYREAILLKIDGLSTREIATHQGIAVSLAGKHISRGRQKIEDRLRRKDLWDLLWELNE